MPIRESRTRAVIAAGLIVGLWALAAGAGEPIKIVSICPLSGAAVRATRESTQGIRCGVWEVNRRGGVLERPLELIEIDNRSTPIGSKAAADRAIAAGAVALVGPPWSSHALAVARVAQAAGIPMISNLATAPEVTRVGDYIFRTCFTDQFQGQVLADFARRDLAAASVVSLINVTSDYSMGLAREFRRRFESTGGRILAELSYKTEQSDFRELIAPLAGLAPAALFIPGYDESGAIIAAAAAAGVTATPIGGDGWGTASFFDHGGQQAREAYYCSHWSPEVQTPASRRFMETYREFDPHGLIEAGVALGFDTVLLLADAIGRAGSVNAQAIRDALAATRDFEGATGTISYMTGSGDPQKSAVIMAIRNGQAFYRQSISSR